MNAILDIEAFSREIASTLTPREPSWRPIFIRLAPSDYEILTGLCREHHIAIVDTIDRQLMDLAAVRMPSTDRRRDREVFIEQTVTARGGPASGGTWVYFPWEAKVVHLLNRDEYFEVVTCDSLEVKQYVRRLAKDRGLNLVYAADERGFLSIEPYQYWRDLQPFHGRVDRPQSPREAFPTPLAFMEALSEWMGGWINLSERSQRSLRSIGESLCGYPQLAGEARYAAGQIAHVARRLLLGEEIPPYCGNLDLADLLPSIESLADQSHNK